MNNQDSPKMGVGEALPESAAEILNQAAEYFYDNITHPQLMNWIGRSFECLRKYSKNAGITYLYSEEKQVDNAIDHLVSLSVVFMPELLKCHSREETVAFLRNDQLEEWMFDREDTRELLVTISKAIVQSPFIDDLNGFAVAEVFRVQTNLFHLSEIMLDYREATKTKN